MKEGLDILDVACGTGVMEQFLLKYNPKSIVAVDIAENMIKKAKEKYNDNRIEFICDDIHNIKDRKFDYVIIYNAFPHFLSSLMSVSRPAQNIRTITPISDKCSIKSVWCKAKFSK